MVQQIIKRYSIAFKKQVVAEYEAGRTIYDLRQRYGITGATTIKKWIEQYGRAGLRHKVIMIQQPAEQERVKKLAAKVKQLEAVVAQLTIDKFVLEKTLEVAEAELGYEVKKKSPTGLSAKPKPVTGRQA